MPEVIFPGPEGRLEGRYHPQKDRDAPIAIILHPHPQFGGTMNNKVVYNLHYAFFNMGFTVLRFNFRGVGRSQGEYDQGVGELSDAASALDYLQSMNNNSKHCWVAGLRRVMAHPISRWQQPSCTRSVQPHPVPRPPRPSRRGWSACSSSRSRPTIKSLLAFN